MLGIMTLDANKKTYAGFLKTESLGTRGTRRVWRKFQDSPSGLYKGAFGNVYQKLPYLSG